MKAEKACVLSTRASVMRIKYEIRVLRKHEPSQLLNRFVQKSGLFPAAPRKPNIPVGNFPREPTKSSPLVRRRKKEDVVRAQKSTYDNALTYALFRVSRASPGMTAPGN